MSTNAIIAKKLPDNRYKGILLHWDGYPRWAGKILSEHYKDEDKIDKLLKLGNISSLAPEIDPDPDLPHGFYPVKAQANAVLAFLRDRGESNQEAQEFFSKHYLKGHFSCAEYLYIWENGEWTWEKM